MHLDIDRVYAKLSEGNIHAVSLKIFSYFPPFLIHCTLFIIIIVSVSKPILRLVLFLVKFL